MRNATQLCVSPPVTTSPHNAALPPPGGLSVPTAMSKQSFRDQLLAHLEEREERAEFLANASKLMIRTSKVVWGELGEDETLAALAGLALPHKGAWSILDVLDGDTTRRVPVIHPVPRQQSLARALSTAWPPPRHGSDGARVFRDRKSVV